jgi:hypothetical protein
MAVRTLTLVLVVLHVEALCTNYNPSALETSWVEAFEKWDVEGHRPLKNDLCKLHHPVTRADASTMSCDGRTVYLEPLTDLLRMPTFPCETTKWPAPIDFHYLWFAGGYNDVPKIPEGRQAIFLDLGAGIWSKQIDMFNNSAMEWLVLKYERESGVQWDKVMAWELHRYSEAQLYQGVPDHIKPKMVHFNQPATADRTQENWPWRHVLAAHPDDFVVIKMDIDTAHIENPLAEQIMTDPELYGRVDVFFWEKHWHRANKHSDVGCAQIAGGSKAEHAAPGAGETPCVHPGGFHKQGVYHGGDGNREVMLADVYRNFTHLRKMGILAHPWF